MVDSVDFAIATVFNKMRIKQQAIQPLVDDHTLTELQAYELRLHDFSRLAAELRWIKEARAMGMQKIDDETFNQIVKGTEHHQSPVVQKRSTAARQVARLG